MVSEVTVVAVAAALAARHQASGGISRRARDHALALFLQHFGGEDEVIAIRRTILDQAVELTQRYRLRGHDAVQSAAAQAANDALLAAGLAGPIFVAADTDPVAVARAEG